MCWFEKVAMDPHVLAVMPRNVGRHVFVYVRYLFDLLRRVRRGIHYRRTMVRKRKYDTNPPVLGWAPGTLPPPGEDNTRRRRRGTGVGNWANYTQVQEI